jgi:hypothetical protein
MANNTDLTWTQEDVINLSKELSEHGWCLLKTQRTFNGGLEIEARYERISRGEKTLQQIVYDFDQKRFTLRQEGAA